MSSRRKRPCCICHHWFLPDNRVGSRQHTCGRPECRQQRRRKMQAAWRARYPDYFSGRRIQARMVPDPPPSPAAQPRRSSPPAPSSPPTSSPPTSSRPPAPLRLRAPLNQLPWDIAQSEFGPQGADFIGIMAGLLLQKTHSEIAAYRVEITAVTEKLRPPCTQSPIPPDAYLSGSGGEAASHATGIPPT
jgi:hypothetical protein